MKIYHYHPITKEFLGEGLADQDPLDANNWLIPANSTNVEPPVVGINEVAIFDNGVWTITSDFRGTSYYQNDGSKIDITEIGINPEDDVEYFGEIAPPAKLEDLKAAKNAEINQARLTANQTTFTHNGKVIACDPLSRSDIDGINGYVATRGEMPPNWVGGWKAVDNSIVSIPDVVTWNAFFDSMIAQGQANFAKSEGLKAQLNAATTPEQVAAITW